MRISVIILITVLSLSYSFSQNIAQLYMNPTNHEIIYNENEVQYQYINDIYEQVKLAFPEEKEFPELEVYSYYSEGNSKIACVTKKSLKIDYNVVDTCLRVFNNIEKVKAIFSYIIGHELSHYIHREKDKNFSCSLFANDTLSQAKKDSLHKIELERDKEGHFYARVAGFRPNQAIDAFFMEIYPHFVKDSTYYPSNQKRLDEIKSTYTEADRLYHIFETAHYLSVLGYYHEAATLYEYLIQHFPSREMYYNAACVNLMEIGYNEIFKLNNYKMALPFEINSTLKGKKDLKKQEIELYFQQINTYIQKLRILSPNYKLLPIIEIYYRFFKDEYHKKTNYDTYIQEVKALCNQYHDKDSLLIGTIENFIGIVYGITKQDNQASLYFESAIKHGINAAIYNKNSINKLASIDNNVIYKETNLFYTEAFEENNFPTIMNTSNIFIKLYTIDSLETDLFFIQNIDNERFYFEKNTMATTKSGIKAGANFSAVKNIYGENYKEYLNTTGKIIHYPNDNKLIFVFNKDNKLMYWVHHR